MRPGQAHSPSWPGWGQAARENGIWSFGLLAAGLLYYALPYDLIPDAQPYGLTDDAAFMLAAAFAAWRTAPAAFRERTIEGSKFRLRVLRADLGNFGLIEHRYVDGFLISGKNSGSHWIKYMLSLALAEKHGLEPPRFCSGREADRIVGRASRARCGRGYPQIATSHTIPSIVLAVLPWPRFVRQPPIVLLVRNIPDAMCSGYHKWQDRYRVPFAEFVRGDPSGKRFIADIWWYVHFFNRWGALHRRQQARVLLVRYEDVVTDPALWFARIAAHFRLGFSEAEHAHAVTGATKDRMRNLQDPDAGETIVPMAGYPGEFSQAHLRVMQDIAGRYLHARSLVPGRVLTGGAAQHAEILRVDGLRVEDWE